MKILETARLSLRTLTTDDAAFYLALINDPSWLANIGDKGIRTLEGARANILSGAMQMQRRLGYSLYVVERKEDGALLGLCGLIRRDTLPDTDIGYAISPPYWGHGYAYEAAAAVVAYARDELRLLRLYGITSPANTASNALLKKLGLSFQELVHLTPEDQGTNLYRLEFAR